MILLNKENQNLSVSQIRLVLQQSQLLYPPLLKYADKVALIAPAGAPHKKIAVAKSKKFLEKLGFKVKLGKSINKRDRYLAGKDKERAADINEAFKDKTIKAIFCLRGGYGSLRVLDLLDFKTIKKNHKPFIGFSDITALHIAFRKHAGLITFHGPTINSLSIRKDTQTARSTKFLFELLTEKHKKIILKAGKVIIKGSARGELVGGNLATLVSLIGSRHQPDLRGCILYLEEISEAPYKLDRLLTQLDKAGMLAEIKGVACGVFKECGKEQEIIKILVDRFAKLKVPVLYGLPFGHVATNLTIMNGSLATINHKGELAFSRL